MGWTVFACFGYTKKRKRPKTTSKFSSSSRRRIRGYEPLQSDVLKQQDTSETISSPRENSKEEGKARIRKKVRFNLDVVAYEPLSSYDEEDDSNWDERGNEETEHVAAAGATAVAAAGAAAVAAAGAAAAAEAGCLLYVPLSKTITAESSYRYNNCYDGEDEYDEDDDSECQISDDDDEDDHDSDAGCTVDLQNIYCEEVSEKIREKCSSETVICSATNARLRSHYIAPVLNPVENLSQWKAVKTRKR